MSKSALVESQSALVDTVGDIRLVITAIGNKIGNAGLGPLLIVLSILCLCLVATKRLQRSYEASL